MRKHIEATNCKQPVAISPKRHEQPTICINCGKMTVKAQ